MRLDEDVRTAIEASNLRSLPPEVISRFADEASGRHAPAGSMIHPEGNTAPHLELVVSGLVRVHVTARDGRTMTVRYCRPGALIGMVSLFADRFANPAAIQAVTEADLVAFRPAVVQAAAERDPKVARALLNELGERVLSFIAEIRDSAFATVRQRVARRDSWRRHTRRWELRPASGTKVADSLARIRETVRTWKSAQSSSIGSPCVS